MKQNIIFTVILLAMLSMVNAIPHPLYKRDTTFVPCPSGFPNEIDVSIQPDVPVSGQPLMISVSGTLTSGTIDEGSQLFLEAMDTTGAELFDPIIVNFCTGGITCPIPTGGVFSAILSGTLTGTLPETYTLVTAIMDSAGAPIACAMGTVTSA